MNALGTCPTSTNLWFSFVVWMIEWIAHMGLLLLLPVSSRLHSRLGIQIVIRKYHLPQHHLAQNRVDGNRLRAFSEHLLWWSLIT